ncbi:MAG TPA: glutamyl-tRNA reductase [Parafilimonas sp.]|nr:glutamyl-tRNA reductase [Parafilimonas sp.]
MNTKSFYVAGINYKRAEAETRSQFALDTDKCSMLLTNAPAFSIDEVFVLSTCNRTEIYGFANDVTELTNLLCTYTAGNAEDFLKIAYIKKDAEAVEHLFKVGAGLDSQILGDYEIVGQLKTAVKFAKQHQRIGAFTERLVNSVLQASKAIKTNTQLSGGTVSVAFAAVQLIRESIINVSDKKILLLGVGKIGRNACKNLVDYLGTKNITLLNRSHEKAFSLANELGLKAAPIAQLQNEIDVADVILVATNADSPVVLNSNFRNNKQRLVIDLSIPCNVEETVRELPFVKLVNVDELSKMKDETLSMRQAEIPKAKAIINEVMEEFYDWYKMRRNVPMLTSLKHTLKEIHTSSPIYFDAIGAAETVDVRIQKVLNETAGKIKTENQKGCFFIKAINDFICIS